MRLILITFSFLITTFSQSQSPMINCFPFQVNDDNRMLTNEMNINPKSSADMKIIRVNFHFMLRSDGTGNFNELNDGDGRNFSGYDYARKLVFYMESQTQNFQLNIPYGNTIPVVQKKYKYVLDAVYFWRNDATYNFHTINYSTQGKDKDSVFNVFLSNGPGSLGGYASNLSMTSHEKYTENRNYWAKYVSENAIGNSDGGAWVAALNTSHEIGHLLTLSHTVQYNSSAPCPVGCPGLQAGVDPGANISSPIDNNCDDGCSDTPSAWAITQANNCNTHPACGFNGGVNNLLDCSNNLMDYTGVFCLSPCQIDKIHLALEGGLRSYTSCAAVADDVHFLDLGYPKVSYFGKIIRVGNSTNLANITNQEKIAMYYSNSVELNNFEVRTDSEFEVILEPVCAF